MCLPKLSVKVKNVSNLQLEIVLYFSKISHSINVYCTQNYINKFTILLLKGSSHRKSILSDSMSVTFESILNAHNNIITRKT